MKRLFGLITILRPLLPLIDDPQGLRFSRESAAAILVALFGLLSLAGVLDVGQGLAPAVAQVVDAVSGLLAVVGYGVSANRHRSAAERTT